MDHGEKPGGIDDIYAKRPTGWLHRLFQPCLRDQTLGPHRKLSPNVDILDLMPRFDFTRMILLPRAQQGNSGKMKQRIVEFHFGWSPSHSQQITIALWLFLADTSRFTLLWLLKVLERVSFIFTKAFLNYPILHRGALWGSSAFWSYQDPRCEGRKSHQS